MGEPIYYGPDGLTQESELQSIVNDLIVSIYDDLVNDVSGGVTVNIGFKFKLPFASISDVAFQVYKEGDDYFVNTIKIATGTISAALISDAIVMGLVAAGVLGGASTIGAIATGAIVATDFLYLYDKYIGDGVAYLADILNSTINDEFIIRADWGGLSGGVLYKDGIGTLSPIAAAEALATKALQTSADIPHLTVYL